MLIAPMTLARLVAAPYLSIPRMTSKSKSVSHLPDLGKFKRSAGLLPQHGDKASCGSVPVTEKRKV